MLEKPDLRIAAVVGVTLTFLLTVGNLYWQVDRMRGEMTNLRQSVVAEVTKLTQAAQAVSKKGGAPAIAVEPSRKMLESFKEELAAELSSTKRQAVAAAQHAKAEAVSHADRLAERIGEERQSQHKEVVGELGEIKQTEASTTAKINDVSADIVNIKNEVA